MAPTGNAAALVGGSTYHSILGLNDKGSFTVSLAKVRSRLDGVDYTFLDEVSMLSCHDMYKISVQLAKAFNEPNKPFGGMNFVFAGDFGQLPPVGGESISLYSGNIGVNIYSGLSHYGQESAIGKALWHQVTTVVILRENMRQNYNLWKMQSFAKLLRICDIKLVLRKTLYFYAHVLQDLEQIDQNWLTNIFEMSPLSQHGIHEKTESMNLAQLDLQMKLTNPL